jgi:hypothetical protein
MARVMKHDSGKSTRLKAWLKLADDVKRHPGTAGRSQHAPNPGASAERVHELAGVIRLSGLVPNWRFLEEEEGEAR